MRTPSNSASILSSRARKKASAGPSPGRPPLHVRAPVLPGIQHRVAPGLSVGVGAAGRRAHLIVAQEQRPMPPEIPLRHADLQVAEQLHPPGLQAGLELGVLGVDHELAEVVKGDLPRLPAQQPAPAALGRALLARQRAVKVLVGGAGALAPVVGPTSAASRRCRTGGPAPRTRCRPPASRARARRTAGTRPPAPGAGPGGPSARRRPRAGRRRWPGRRKGGGPARATRAGAPRTRRSRTPPAAAPASARPSASGPRATDRVDRANRVPSNGRGVDQ